MKLSGIKYVIISILLLTMCISIYAQNINVRGRVVGKYDGDPLVSVIVKAIFANGKDSIVDWTDADGKFYCIRSRKPAFEIPRCLVEGYNCYCQGKLDYRNGRWRSMEKSVVGCR